ncbi:MAG: hypothetical protein HY925_16605 [Elusimicrobia bacterium]|nr:hypothetical protein [Elusimicrobiota bacterium]
MAREAKNKKNPEDFKGKSIEQLILDQGEGKYGLVPLASTWALVLRRRDENRHLTQPELLDLALRQILTGEIDEDAVKASAEELAAQAVSPDGTSDSKKPKL